MGSVSEVLIIVLTGIIGYLLGSVNSSLVVGKFYGVDVRNHGSGNAGATNTLRTLGKKAAIIATLGDMVKGFIACIIGLLIAKKTGMISEEMGIMIAGIAAIIGHNWPIFFKFKGGKGVLTSLAVVLMMDPIIALIALGTFIIVAAITRFVSLGSIVATLLFTILAATMFGKSSEFIIFSSILTFLIIFRHRTNIVRIIKGTESKLGAKKK
jgi:acyl phosphate:glycerol-3-phosphate acyltransferase